MVKQWNKDDCLQAFKDLADSLDPDKVITRDFFRKNSPCPEYAWSKYFGTFSEFRIHAGFDFSPHQTKHLNNIAKHSSKDKLKAMNYEKASYEGKYERPDSKRFQSILTISDTHDISFDPFTKRVFLDTLHRVKPETVVLNGDHFDLPEFSKYFNDPRSYNLIERIESVHEFFSSIREAVPDAEINFISANHECVEEYTEILTEGGWKDAKDVSYEDKIASYTMEESVITYNNPVAIKHIKDQQLIHIKGHCKDELIYENHRIDVDDTLQNVGLFLGKEIHQKRFKYSGLGDQTGISLNDEQIKLITWVSMDGCLVYKNNNINRIQFKLSKERKIERLCALLKSINIKYTLKMCKKGEVNVLQPYYIRIYGDDARYIESLLGENKTLPQQFKYLNSTQLKVFLEELSFTDGSKQDSGIIWRSVNKTNVDIVQIACVKNNVSFYFKAKENDSGFTKNGKLQYICTINKSPIGKATIEESGFGNVVAIQSIDGTLITRRNGKVAFTGNCRLLRHLAESSPSIMVLLSDLHGFTVSKLLGLDKFEINYISREDLSVFTESDLKKELGKNYLIKFDSTLFHHYPEGKKYGIPGCNGHHHSHKCESMHNLTYGTYEWHQLGGGHVRKAVYCEGQRWSNGFMISHHDTHNKSTVFEYVDTTSNHTVVGGKWYQRTADEIVVL